MSFRQALDRVQPNDPLLSFLITDLDEGGIPKYYGYCTASSAWMIRQYNETAGTMRYAFGVDDYATAWANRASLTYNLPNVMD